MGHQKQHGALTWLEEHCGGPLCPVPTLQQPLRDVRGESDLQNSLSLKKKKSQTSDEPTVLHLMQRVSSFIHYEIIPKSG